MITTERVEGAATMELSSVQPKLDAVRAADNFTIFRVKAHVRQGNNKHLYEPEMVAIGPYSCREEPSLRAMEEHKWQYVKDFLSRRNTTIEYCIAKIQEEEPRARRCYFERVELSTEEFVEMLLLNGCFIVEFLIKWNEGDNDCKKLLPMKWSNLTIRTDLLMLENQIPFFVLDKLFKIEGTAATPVQRPEISTFMVMLLVKFLAIKTMEISWEILIGNIVHIVLHEGKDFNHLLHFYYHLNVTKPQTDPTGCTNCGTILKWLNPLRVFTLLLSYVRSKTDTSNEKRFSGTIPSATELLEAGVTIKKKKNQNQNHLSSFLDVTFCPRDGVLEIPFLIVENSTLPLFSNLMAFEQCGGCKSEEAYITSYAAFMDCLVNTPEDEAILRQRGILQNNLPSDEHLAVFFNQLSEWLVLDFEEHYLAELFLEVGEYCDSTLHKWRAKLVRDYFSNPWASLSVIAALFVLVLTFLQTLYTILSYVK